jgi:hypothetical protein
MFGLRRSPMRCRPLLQRPDELGADVSDSQLAHYRLQIIAFIACNMRGRADWQWVDGGKDARVGRGKLLISLDFQKSPNICFLEAERRATVSIAMNYQRGTQNPPAGAEVRIRLAAYTRANCPSFLREGATI